MFDRWICLVACLYAAFAATRSEGQQVVLPTGPNDVQTLELIPHRAGGWVFPLMSPTRLVWRDAAMASHLGMQSPPEVRWFDRSLSESKQPDHPGRWIAWVDGTAPSGLPFRRS